MFCDFGSLYQDLAGVAVASCCGSGQFSDVAVSSVLTVAAAAKKVSTQGEGRWPTLSGEPEAEGRQHRDGCVACDRRTPVRINTALVHHRQPPSLPLCLRCSSGSRSS